MLKVCHMTSVHNSKDVRIFYKMCTSLAATGYKTYLVAPGESFIENGVNVIGVGSSPTSRLKRMTQMARKVYKSALALDADIYHFHDPELLPYGLKLKRKGKKVIFDSHEDVLAQIEDKVWIPTPLRTLSKKIFDKYQRYVCHRLSCVISVSPHICEYFQSLGVKTYMVCNFPLLSDNSRYISPTFNNRNIVFAGGISQQWGHFEILEALQRVPNTNYFLCGSACPTYLKELESLQEWERVNYLGKVPHKQVSYILSKCQIGMCILHYSGNTGGKTGTLGNTKLFEYMQAGLPVICSNFILWEQMISQYKFGICVDPKNTEEIASAIQYLLDNPEQARKMGERGRQAVLEKYNWKVEEKKLLSLYQSL